tara:strand:- start:1406 stop:2101 length:696 start_codon:yes stop_codon:yes gene_type:complete
MSYEKEIQFEPTLVCNKGNMILNECIIPETEEKQYNLKFDFEKLNPLKINIKSLLSPSIYELIEQVTPELVEKVYILKFLNENETDLCILFKSFGKEVGIKQKYIIFRTTRGINYFSNTIEFYNKDITLIDHSKVLLNKYLKQIQVDTNKYEPIIFNYGKTLINLKNLEPHELLRLNNGEPFVSIMNIDFSIDFIATIEDDLPLYMQNIIGLMFKKIFYNLKQFIDKLNNF